MEHSALNQDVSSRKSSLMRRWMPALTMLVVTFSISGYLWWYQYNRSALQDNWGYVLLVLVPGVISGIMLAWTAWHPKAFHDLKDPFESGTVESIDESSGVGDRWFVRYTIAMLFCYAAWEMRQEGSLPRDESNALTIFALLMALYQARELAWIVLPVVGLWIAYKLVALLPVSVAIMLGASIIAAAIVFVAKRK